MRREHALAESRAVSWGVGPSARELPRSAGGRRAFTLVEILVVIGIIALLIAILLPVLSKARESSNRVKCAAHLHNMGIAAIQFANDHQGIFPTAYQMPDPAYPFRFPALMSMDDSLMDKPANKWKSFGVPFSEWQKYGVEMATLACPSADYQEVKTYTTAGGAPPEWGDVLWTHYMWIAGLTTKNKGKSTTNWGMAEPALKLNDRDGYRKILAADMVFYSGNGTKWYYTRPPYMINHVRQGGNSANARLPSAQNVLYADGRVETRGGEVYTSALNQSNNYSLLHAGSGVGGYFYWGPDLTPYALNPPPPPKPPTTPTPTPTPTPPNPNPTPPPPPPPPPILPNPL